MISKKVAKLVSANEAAKYKLHIEEIGHITSLLLGLSGRLAKVENSLYEVAVDNQNEKVIWMVPPANTSLHFMQKFFKVAKSWL